MEAEKPLSIDDFIPVVGKNYIAPHILLVPNGAYKEITYPRAVLLIPQTPATTGIVYIYPGAFPATDVSSIPIPSGNNVYLDARGKWYLKTSSSGTEKFLVIDAGAAGNAAAIAASFGSTPAAAPANRGAWYAAQKTVAVPSTAEQCAAQAIPNGFALAITAMITNSGNIGIGSSAANADLVTGAPLILAPGASARLFVTNANLVWVDAIVAGNGVCLSAEV